MKNYQNLKESYENLTKVVKDTLNKDDTFEKNALLKVCKQSILNSLSFESNSIKQDVKETVPKKIAKPKKENIVEAFVEISSNKKDWEVEIENLLKDNFFLFANKVDATKNDNENKFAIVKFGLNKKNIVTEKQDHKGHKIYEVTKVNINQINNISLNNKTFDFKNLQGIFQSGNKV